jgi:hypothetical protein
VIVVTRSTILSADASRQLELALCGGDHKVVDDSPSGTSIISTRRFLF